MDRNNPIALIPPAVSSERGRTILGNNAVPWVGGFMLVWAFGISVAPSPAKPPDVPLPSNATIRIGTERFRQAGTVEFLAFLPDGNHIISSGADDSVCLWDLSSGRRVWSQSHEYHERRFLLSPDGKTLISDGDGRIILRDTATGKVRLKFFGRDTYHCKAISPDGKIIVGGGWNEALTFWDATNGNELKSTRFREKRRIELLTISHDGKRLAGSTYGDNFLNELNAWNMATPKQDLLADVKGEGFAALCFSPDDSILALSRKKQVVLREALQGKELRVLDGHTEDVTCFVFTPDGKTLISSSEDATTRFWDVASGKEVRKLRKHIYDVLAMALTKDGKLLATAGTDRRICFWDVATGKELYSDNNHLGRIVTVAFTPDSKHLITSGSSDATIRTWDLATGKQVSSIEKSGGEWEGQPVLRVLLQEGRQGTMYMGRPRGGPIVLSPDGKTTALSGIGIEVLLWDTTTGKLRAKAKGNWSQSLVTFLPDSQTLVYFDDRFRFCNVATGKQSQEIAVPGGSRARVAFCPRTMTSATYAAGSETGWRAGLRLWDMARGKELPRVLDDWDRVDTINFSADGWLLATLGAPPGGKLQAMVLDVVTGEVMMLFPAFGKLSPDSRLLVNTHVKTWDDRKAYLRFWDVVTGEERAEWATGSGGVSAMAFSPDGKKLATALHTGSILIWDLTKLPPAKNLPKVVPLTAKRFEDLWKALGNTNENYEMSAHLYELTAGGEAAVALLKARLRPAKSSDLKWVRQQIEQLGQENARTRSAALKELERVAGTVEPLLRQALDDDPSPTLREGLETLLKTKWFVRSPDILRAVRGIQVLERIGTPQARAVLEAMAKGWPLAQETRYARQALLPMP